MSLIRTHANGRGAKSINLKVHRKLGGTNIMPQALLECLLALMAFMCTMEGLLCVATGAVGLAAIIHGFRQGRKK